MKNEILDINQVLTTLRSKLPNIVRDLIASRSDIPESVKESFSANYDSPIEHSPLWHQYGILTHSQEFQRIIVSEVPELLRQWGIFDVTHAKLSEEIQGVSKVNLLQIASLLHDLGKFTTRTYDPLEDDTLHVNFDGHEADSGGIIKLKLKDTLLDLGYKKIRLNILLPAPSIILTLVKPAR